MVVFIIGVYIRRWCFTRSYTRSFSSTQFPSLHLGKYWGKNWKPSWQILKFSCCLEIKKHLKIMFVWCQNNISEGKIHLLVNESHTLIVSITYMSNIRKILWNSLHPKNLNPGGRRRHHQSFQQKLWRRVVWIDEQ